MKSLNANVICCFLSPMMSLFLRFPFMLNRRREFVNFYKKKIPQHWPILRCFYLSQTNDGNGRWRCPASDFGDFYLPTISKAPMLHQTLYNDFHLVNLIYLFWLNWTSWKADKSKINLKTNITNICPWCWCMWHSSYPCQM